MPMTDYPTRNRDKALALFNALMAAGVQTNFIDHGAHYHVVHNADADTFTTARASINFPSSLEAEIANVIIPDDPSSIA